MSSDRGGAAFKPNNLAEPCTDVLRTLLRLVSKHTPPNGKSKASNTSERASDRAHTMFQLNHLA